MMEMMMNDMVVAENNNRLFMENSVREHNEFMNRMNSVSINLVEVDSLIEDAEYEAIIEKHEMINRDIDAIRAIMDAPIKLEIKDVKMDIRANNESFKEAQERIKEASLRIEKEFEEFTLELI